MTTYLVNSNPRGTHTTQTITFTHEDTIGVHYPYCDALVVRAVVARNDLNRMLVDNGSSVNILFGVTYGKMQISHGLIPMTAPLYGFTRDGIVPSERITLAVDMGTAYNPPSYGVSCRRSCICVSRGAGATRTERALGSHLHLLSVH